MQVADRVDSADEVGASAVLRGVIMCRSGGKIWALGFAIVLLGLVFVPLANKGQAQLVAMPVVLLLFWGLRFYKVEVPRSCIFVATVGCAIGALIQFSHVNLKSGAFVVSTVSDHDLRQQTKIYRDRLRRAVGSDGDAMVGMHTGEITSIDSARRLLQSSSTLSGVIWGSARWMSVLLRQYQPLKLSTFPKHSVGSDLLESSALPDIFIVRSIPMVGMSHGHELGTVHFLSTLIEIWPKVPEVLALQGFSDDFEASMERLARSESRWTSQAHKALPLWLLGTTALIHSIEGPVLQRAELRCALRNFRQSLSLFRTHDNPALEMAVRNNYGVALLIQSEQAKSMRAPRKKAIRQFLAARKLRKLSPEVSPMVVHNHLVVVPATKKKGKNGKRQLQ